MPAQNTEALDVLESLSPEVRDRIADLYGQLCDVVERAWQHWPVERDEDEADVRHTSDYAREAANKILSILFEGRVSG